MTCRGCETLRTVIASATFSRVWGLELCGSRAYKNVNSVGPSQWAQTPSRDH